MKLASAPERKTPAHFFRFIIKVASNAFGFWVVQRFTAAIIQKFF
jgi:hypothetical protein